MMGVVSFPRKCWKLSFYGKITTCIKVERIPRFNIEAVLFRENRL